MPHRPAGPPKRRALRIRSLGKVSASAVASLATASSQFTASKLAAARPLAAVYRQVIVVP